MPFGNCRALGCEVESVWRTASWLCFVQGLGQLCPLPRTIGRQLLAAFVAL